MPALLDSRTDLTQFRALSTAGKVDAAAGVIYGVSVITQGPALGHNVTVDEKGVKQCLEACQEFGDEGVKLVINHDSGFQEIVGAVKNFRVQGLQLLGDAYLLDSPPDRPHILELAQKMPRNIGLSVETYGEPETIEKKKYWRVDSIDAIALVPNPAANKSGLFSKRKTSLKIAETTIDDLREQVRSAAMKDARFTKTPDAADCCTGVWIADIITDGDSWSAIIQGADQKFYEVSFAVTGGQVALSSSAQEVARKVEYQPVVDTSQGATNDNMDDKALKTLLAETIKPVTDKLSELEKKVNENGEVTKLSKDLDEAKTKLSALEKADQPDLDKIVGDKVAEQLKKDGDQIAADAVTKFAASIGVKKAPDGSTEAGKDGDKTFEGRIATHLSAMPQKDRGKAILRARNDDPKGYNDWAAAGNT
jgi:hypothetical protein